MIIQGFQLCQIYSPHHLSLSFLRIKVNCKPANHFFCFLSEGRTTQLGWTVAPNHRQPISGSRWWCPHPNLPPPPPHMACCRGNSAASTSIALMSLVMAVCFHSEAGWIDHYSAHQVSNQGGTGAEQLGMTWTERNYLFLTRQTTWEENLKKPLIPSGLEICSIGTEMGHSVNTANHSYYY